jgi:hypothetical protein
MIYLKHVQVGMLLYDFGRRRRGGLFIYLFLRTATHQENQCRDC